MTDRFARKDPYSSSDDV